MDFHLTHPITDYLTNNMLHPAWTAVKKGRRMQKMMLIQTHGD
jgi:hypothetical protein